MVIARHGPRQSQNDINALYQQILGRGADSGGLAFWEQTLSTGGSQTTVASGLAYSSEASGDLNAAYQWAYGMAPGSGALLTLEGELANGATLSAIESSLQAPLITDAVGGQAITDHDTVNPFAAMVVLDPNNDAAETATIVLTNSAGTATNANGLLTGNLLTEVSPGTYTISAPDWAALTGELESLVFTPTQGQVSPGQSVTTNMSISVDDGSFTGSDTTTSVIATAVSSGSTMNFIYGSVGNDLLAATSGPDVFAENLPPQGNDVILNFNVAQDIVQLNASAFPDFADVEAATSTVSGSAVIHIDSSDSITLAGVAASSLQASNFHFV